MCDDDSIFEGPPRDGGQVSQVFVRILLDAIAKIRYQKQRPSTERICAAVKQHKNISESVIKEDLKKAVEEGKIIRVRYLDQANSLRFIFCF